MKAALLALLTVTGLVWQTGSGWAATHDGHWSVLVITEKGTCDRAYRYSVTVAGGRVQYQGNTSLDLSGTVAANGAVRVSIQMGQQGASGHGRLSGQSGSGVWHGIGKNSDCSGRWEAERR